MHSYRSVCGHMSVWPCGSVDAKGNPLVEGKWMGRTESQGKSQLCTQGVEFAGQRSSGESERRKEGMNSEQIYWWWGGAAVLSAADIMRDQAPIHSLSTEHGVAQQRFNTLLCVGMLMEGGWRRDYQSVDMWGCFCSPCRNWRVDLYWLHVPVKRRSFRVFFVF